MYIIELATLILVVSIKHLVNSSIIHEILLIALTIEGVWILGFILFGSCLLHYYRIENDVVAALLSLSIAI